MKDGLSLWTKDGSDECITDISYQDLDNGCDTILSSQEHCICKTSDAAKPAKISLMELRPVNTNVVNQFWSPLK